VHNSDLFTAVTRYDKQEDRFTCALTYLLEYLINATKQRTAPRRRLLSFLTYFCGVQFKPDDDSLRLEIFKHEKGKKGKSIYPDFQIISKQSLAWVEVKDTAPVNQDLEEYKTTLQKNAEEGVSRSLVLLRHYFIDPKHRNVADRDLKWSELHRLLKRLDHDLKPLNFDTNGVSHYLLEEFIKYLKEKGVSGMEKIAGKNITNGFGDIMNLFMVIQAEAERVFDENYLKMALSKTTFWGTGITFWFSKDKRMPEKGYVVELWAEDLPHVYMASTGENIKALEGRGILEDKLQEYVKKGVLEYDEGWIYSHRSLDKVFRKNKAEEQSDEIHILLESMFMELESIKPRKRGRPKQ